ncbi:Mobile element protein [Candidatus Enterovibrio altilux]|uniref:Mobile element protein n=1 Tax=Candidatus Enterovibrio altilux TaxID=1927128 RepID=A0A291B790_9GAMM|nr:Mobile element protein [Candidatus Enterovibrio luxaltus]
MIRVKNLLGGTLSLRDNTTQISKIYAMIKALNKLIKLGIHNTKAVV